MRSFDTLEPRAEKAVTPSELQAWGNRMLSLYPTGATPSLAELDTNFPAKLRDIAPELGPHIVVYAPQTDVLANVIIYWGSGFLGHKGFEIGPTNFTGMRGHRAWTNGVYFWQDGQH